MPKLVFKLNATKERQAKSKLLGEFKNVLFRDGGLRVEADGKIVAIFHLSRCGWMDTQNESVWDDLEVQ